VAAAEGGAAAAGGSKQPCPGAVWLCCSQLAAQGGQLKVLLLEQRLHP
jgi:hypothetical protein